jgi:hypothetical protein
MVWVIAMIIGTISTFIPTKHMNNKCHMYLRSTCQNNKTKVSCYTKYGLGVFLLIHFLYPFARPTSCVCSTPSWFLHHLVHLLGIGTHMHVVCRQFQLMPYLPPSTSPQESTSSPCLKRGILLGFRLVLIVIWGFDP